MKRSLNVARRVADKDALPFLRPSTFLENVFFILVYGRTYHTHRI